MVGGTHSAQSLSTAKLMGIIQLPLPCNSNDFGYIPFILESARLLAALIRPNHLVRLSSWGLIHLSPPCNSNDFGYSFNKRGDLLFLAKNAGWLMSANRFLDEWYKPGWLIKPSSFEMQIPHNHAL